MDADAAALRREGLACRILCFLIGSPSIDGYNRTLRYIAIGSQERMRSIRCPCSARGKKERRMEMSEKKIPYKIYLEESEMPKQWYNVRADMKNKPAPLLNPGTLKPMTFEELQGVFCDELVKQE